MDPMPPQDLVGPAHALHEPCSSDLLALLVRDVAMPYSPEKHGVKPQQVHEFVRRGDISTLFERVSTTL